MEDKPFGEEWCFVAIENWLTALLLAQDRPIPAHIQDKSALQRAVVTLGL
jgi:hypothetical protein